jgi:D-glycero-D-manno-heptose 1,7-bisphosphate phosphatase
MKKGVFLDRDGVINRKADEENYITRWEDFHFLPEVADGIKLLNRAGWSVIVISNQRCVAKGLLSVETLETIHRRMSEELGKAGASVDGIYYCPHEKDAACNCRKPAPGMLLAAAKEHQIDLRSSWMIGDSESDVGAGRRAGCRTLQLVANPESASGDADLYASSLIEASRRILKDSLEKARFLSSKRMA